MADPTYVPPQVWEWKQKNGGKFANTNRPVARATHEKALSVGKHPLQLYSLGTPNGQKVTIMLEELLAAGIRDAEYDAWLIDIGEGDQFGSGLLILTRTQKFRHWSTEVVRSRYGSLNPEQFLRIWQKNFPCSCRKLSLNGLKHCHGCSGRWDLHHLSAAGLAISMRMHRKNMNIRLTATRWKPNAS